MIYHPLSSYQLQAVAGMSPAVSWAFIAGFLKAYFDTSEVIVAHHAQLYGDLFIRLSLACHLPTFGCNAYLEDNATLKMQ